MIRKIMNRKGRDRSKGDLKGYLRGKTESRDVLTPWKSTKLNTHDLGHGKDALVGWVKTWYIWGGGKNIRLQKEYRSGSKA